MFTSPAIDRNGEVEMRILDILLKSIQATGRVNRPGRAAVQVPSSAAENAGTTATVVTEPPATNPDAAFADCLLRNYEQIIRQTERTTERERRMQILRHPVGETAPEVPCVIVPDLQPTAADQRIAQRLLKAYARTADAEAAHRSRPENDLWTRLRGVQSTFLDILAGGDAAHLAEYLCGMGRQDATVGIDQGHLEFQRISAVPSYRAFAALHIKDILVSLAEAVGAIPCENPEQGPWGESIHQSAEQLAELVAQTLGVDITPPLVDGGLLKIHAGAALLGARDLHALYTAWSLKRFVPNVEEARICEIGGGSGRVAYWMSRFGVRAYTILDLPHINVVQGWYLLKSRPDANVVLYGEPDPQAPNQLEILPYFCTEERSDASFDLVLNQDSFPEVSRDVVLGYLRWIKKVARFFLSINQESRPPLWPNGVQLNVPELVALTGGYRRVSRELYWLRKGYATELYSVAAN
jgi:hypothetical protein